MEQTDGQDRIESLDTDPVTNSSQLTLEKEQRQQNEVLGGGVFSTNVPEQPDIHGPNNY